ncbi:MAG: hypothetical protein AAF585_03895 [Verrucomicrobiota bacterium]
MSNINAGLELLKKIRQLDGLAVINAGVYSFCDLSWDEARLKTFKEELITMFQAYANEGRTPQKIVIGSERQTIMLLNQRTVILVLVFSNRDQTRLVERSSELFLNEFAEQLELPVAPESRPRITARVDVSDEVVAWPIFRSRLQSLLTKVIGSSQAERMIDRKLEEDGYNADDGPKPDQFRAFGEALVAQIKDRNLRALIEDELESAIAR